MKYEKNYALLQNEILEDLCDTVEVSGGVFRRGGVLHPVADEDWIDIAEIYARACEVLNRKMVVVEDMNWDGHRETESDMQWYETPESHLFEPN
jgi:hypothetical protein